MAARAQLVDRPSCAPPDCSGPSRASCDRWCRRPGPWHGCFATVRRASAGSGDSSDRFCRRRRGQLRWIPDVGRDRRLGVLLPGPVARFAGSPFESSSSCPCIHHVVRTLRERLGDVFVTGLAGLRSGVGRSGLERALGGSRRLDGRLILRSRCATPAARAARTRSQYCACTWSTA